jgi:antitoxin component YwqK of YwqJK toxin-antitoxin module
MKKLLIIIATTFFISCSSDKEITEKYGNGNPMTQYFVNSENKKQGKYISYYETGQKRSDGNYDNDLQTGFWTTWFENGIKSTEGSNEKGIQVGVWKFFHPNGIVFQINHYTEGKANGVCTEYNDQGRISKKMNYVNGILNGSFFTYFTNGKISSEIVYKENAANGPFIEYYENGNISVKGTYLNDTTLIHEYFKFDSTYSNNFIKTIIHSDGFSSDTDLIYQNNKLIEYRIHLADQSIKTIKVK